MPNEDETRSELVADLMVALLAVNNWTLEKAGALHKSFEAYGLYNVQALAQMQPQDIQERLTAAGYKRGPVLGGIMATRIQRAALALASGGVDALLQYEKTSNTAAARQYLLTLSGVGPTVAENYLLLRASPRL